MEIKRAQNSPVPHILMVSFSGQGHLNPLLRLAKRIAAKGLLVTFCTDVETGRKIASSTATQPGVDHPIGLGFLRFEFLSDQLILKFSDDCLAESLNKLHDKGPGFLAELIRRMADDGRPVSCLVNNPFMPWVQDVAADMNIPGAVLWVQSCAVFSIYYHYYHSLAEFPSETNPTSAVNLPGLPEFKHDELPTFLLPSDPYKSLKSVILEQFNNLSKASWVLLNSFEELESEAIKSLLSNKLSLLPVGPLVEPEDDKNSKMANIRGDMFKVSDCKEWLDSQEPNSVVYVALGSIVALTKDEIAEMAFGLKNSGQPFLWVIRDSHDKLPEGFTDEVKGKGLVVRWSDQERVLKHSSIACFLTHCGWNSTLEALASGKPVIAYPQWGDQVTDAKFLVDEWGVGVKLRKPVLRDELRECVESVMRGDDAARMRSNAKRLRELAERAVAEGGSSERNIQGFVDEIGRRTVGEGARVKQIVGEIVNLDLEK